MLRNFHLLSLMNFDYRVDIFCHGMLFPIFVQDSFPPRFSVISTATAAATTTATTTTVVAAAATAARANYTELVFSQ